MNICCINIFDWILVIFAILFQILININQYSESIWNILPKSGFSLPHLSYGAAVSAAPARHDRPFVCRVVRACVRMCAQCGGTQINLSQLCVRTVRVQFAWSPYYNIIKYKLYMNNECTDAERVPHQRRARDVFWENCLTKKKIKQLSMQVLSEMYYVNLSVLLFYVMCVCVRAMPKLTK